MNKSSPQSINERFHLFQELLQILIWAGNYQNKLLTNSNLNLQNDWKLQSHNNRSISTKFNFILKMRSCIINCNIKFSFSLITILIHKHRLFITIIKSIASKFKSQAEEKNSKNLTLLQKLLRLFLRRWLFLTMKLNTDR